MSILDKISRFFFPRRCVFCGSLSVDGEPCDECLWAAKECEIVGETCSKCGKAKNKCECNKTNYLFSGVAAVYYNIGVAKDGVYGIKMSHRAFAAKYFGEKMADSFKDKFSVVPDVVCSVPGDRKTLRQGGYNHAVLFAKAVAKKLSLPYASKILKKIKNNKPQHTLDAAARRRNVKGVYAATTRLDGKTVLLVDDIKTTGSTLNECAKQLRLMGAKEVYCSVGLISNISCNEGKNKI